MTGTMTATVTTAAIVTSASLVLQGGMGRRVIEGVDRAFTRARRPGQTGEHTNSFRPEVVVPPDLYGRMEHRA